MEEKKTEQEEINEALDQFNKERLERIKAGNPREGDDYAAAFFGFMDRKKKTKTDDSSR